jgi:hypothetical protein
VIPRPYITEWSTRAPWPSESQIEQDLILSRLIVEIANDELLAGELAFRGGTCLHKLHLPRAARWSEDLDYTRTALSRKSLSGRRRCRNRRGAAGECSGLWYPIGTLSRLYQIVTI